MFTVLEVHYKKKMLTFPFDLICFSFEIYRFLREVLASRLGSQSICPHRGPAMTS